jgi:hypothetical protein
VSDETDDEVAPAPGAEAETDLSAPVEPQNNADSAGASVVPVAGGEPAPGKPDRRKRASYSAEELAARAVGLAAHGGGVGARLTKEEKDTMRRAIRNAKKRDERARRAKEKERRRRGPRAKTTEEYVKAPGADGVPAWEPSEAEKEQIMAYAGFGMSIDETSVLLGISEQTLHAHLEKVQSFRAHGLAIAKSRVRQAVYQQAVMGSLGHARFFEERVLGYQPNQRVEMTGADGGPVETRTNAFLSDDDLLARLRTLADKQASVVASVALTTEEADA